MRMALEGRGSTSVDQRYEIPDTGREGFFEAAYSPIFGSDDDVVGGLGIVRDVTERKAAEETIRESETRFRTLAEATFEGIAIVEEGVILDWQRPPRRSVGVRPGRVDRCQRSTT